MKALTFTIITALLTSGWWSLPYLIEGSRNGMVALVFPLTIFYLIWIGILVSGDWE